MYIYTCSVPFLSKLLHHITLKDVKSFAIYEKVEIVKARQKVLLRAEKFSGGLKNTHIIYNASREG